MGVDFSWCKAHWSYCGFYQARKRIAKEVGINLDDMWGYESTANPNCELIRWDSITDDIKILLDHCDCDGYIEPEDCKKLIPRVKEIVKNWDDADYDKINMLELCVGLKWAAHWKKRFWFK